MREARIKGLVSPEVDDAELNRTAERIKSTLQMAGEITPALNRRRIQTRLERMVPGGRTVGRTVRAMRRRRGDDEDDGSGGGSTGGGASTGGGTGARSATQQRERIHRELRRIRIATERGEVTPDAGGEGGGTGGGMGALGGLGAAKLLGAGGLATGGGGLLGLGIGQAVTDGDNRDSLRGMLGMDEFEEPDRDVASLADVIGGDSDFSDLVDFEGSPAAEMISDVKNTFDSLEWPELPDFRGEVNWPELPDLRGEVDWPELPDLRDEVDWPELPDLPELPNLRDEVDWPELPDLRERLEWPELPRLSDELEWPEPPEWFDRITGRGDDGGSSSSDRDNGFGRDGILNEFDIDINAGDGGFDLDRQALEDRIIEVVRREVLP